MRSCWIWHQAPTLPLRCFGAQSPGLWLQHLLSLECVTQPTRNWPLRRQWQKHQHAEFGGTDRRTGEALGVRASSGDGIASCRERLPLPSTFPSTAKTLKPPFRSLPVRSVCVLRETKRLI